MSCKFQKGPPNLALGLCSPVDLSQQTLEKAQEAFLREGHNFLQTNFMGPWKRGEVCG